MRVALTVFFAVHALSAALALGLPVVVVWAAGRRERIAREMTTVMLVNLSVAVVMGVAALLFISRSYPRHFTGAVVGLFPAAMGVLPLLSMAYASLYAYQLKGWKPGPAVAALAILGVAAVFAAIGSWSNRPGIFVRLGHFLPAALAAAGVAVMIRFAGEPEARTGARLAFGASLAQAATGAGYLFSLPDRPTGLLLYAPLGEAAGLIVLLGLFAFGARITRFAALAAAAGMFFVVLSMASLREGVRSQHPSGRERVSGPERTHPRRPEGKLLPVRPRRATERRC